MSRNRGPRQAVNSMGGFRDGPPAPMHAPRPALSVEEELAMRHDEIQRLLAENQLLFDDIAVLRRDLPIVKQEMHALDQTLIWLRADKDMEIRDLIQQGLKLEADMRMLEPVKTDVIHLRNKAQKLEGICAELSGKVQSMSKELHHVQAENQPIPAMRAELDALRDELVRARTAIEFERRAKDEQVDLRQAREKDFSAMSREAEELRAELEKRGKGSVGVSKGHGGYYPHSYRY